MWSVMVALPVVQTDFGVSRAEASLPFTLVMIGFAGGGVLMGRLADRFGIAVPLGIGTLTLSAGYLATGLVVEPVAGRARASADRHRLLGHLRPADGRHLALVRAPPRHRSRDRRLRQLHRRHDLAAGGPALHRDRRLAHDPYRRSALFCLVAMLPLVLADAPRASKAITTTPPARPPRGGKLSAPFSPQTLQVLLCIAGVALLRGDVDAAGAHRRLLRRSRLRRGARRRNAVADARLRHHQPRRLRLYRRPHRRRRARC